MTPKEVLIEKYAADLKEKCGLTADMDLLTKVVSGCGPAIYRPDAETVASSQQEEMDRVKLNFLIKKLGVPNNADLVKGLDAVIETYGKSNKTKYRAVVYYLLTKHFKKEHIYK